MKPVWRRILFLVMLSVPFLSRAAEQKPRPEKQESTTPFESAADELESRVETLLSNLTLEQKIGQLLMVGFVGTQANSQVIKMMKELHAGTVALFSNNIRDAKQVKKLVQDIRESMRGEVQPFISIDQEGGNVVRMKSEVAVLPGAMTLGATRDSDLAYLAGEAIALDLGLLGIDMNMAPVLDINRNASNPVINVRAYGDQPDLVSRLGIPFIQGQQTYGMATVAKHFPGHGSTRRDSHFGLPRIDLSLEELEAIELKPFGEAIKAGLDAIMIAHVQVPALDPSGKPASLSSRIIEDLLRKNYRFDGVVITDDLEMRAISDRANPGEAAIKAITAGADIVMAIWTPWKKKEVYRTLLSAAQKGILSKERIDTSVRRILRLKARRGTLDALEFNSKSKGVLPNSQHIQITEDIASRGLTLVKNEASLVPLCAGTNLLVASAQPIFQSEMKQLLPTAEFLDLRLAPSQQQRQDELSRLLQLSKGKKAIILGVTNAYQAWLVQRLKNLVKIPTVVVSFGSPYLIRHFPWVKGYLCTYSFLPSAQRAAARGLAGKQPITGRLPVTLTPTLPNGHGITQNVQQCIAKSATQMVRHSFFIRF